MSSQKRPVLGHLSNCTCARCNDKCGARDDIYTASDGSRWELFHSSWAATPTQPERHCWEAVHVDYDYAPDQPGDKRYTEPVPTREDACALVEEFIEENS